jgi:protein phosphatase
MYTYAAITDVGTQYLINDDRILIGNQLIREGCASGTVEENYMLAAICDGVGGLAMGDAAAEESLLCLCALNKQGIERSDIRRTVEVANKKVLARQSALNRADGLRTTLAAIYLDGNVLYVINAGDSRVYRFRNHEVTLLSKDHSIVQNLIDTGEITEEEARIHPKRNVITKCIGDEERVNARIIDLTDDIQNGDIWMLCTDGITDCLIDADIREVLNGNRSTGLLDCCKMLIDEAIKNGSADNLSVCLIRKENENGRI